MDIVITNKSSINKLMSKQAHIFGVIAVSDPYPDPIKYDIPCTNRFRGLFKLEFYDSDKSTMTDDRLIYNENIHRAFIQIVSGMINIGVERMIIHCDKGQHRSVALALGVKSIFNDINIIEGLPDNPEPNMHVLLFFQHVP